LVDSMSDADTASLDSTTASSGGSALDPSSDLASMDGDPSVTTGPPAAGGDPSAVGSLPPVPEGGLSDDENVEPSLSEELAALGPLGPLFKRLVAAVAQPIPEVQFTTDVVLETSLGNANVLKAYYILVQERQHKAQRMLQGDIRGAGVGGLLEALMPRDIKQNQVLRPAWIKELTEGKPLSELTQSKVRSRTVRWLAESWCIIRQPDVVGLCMQLPLPPLPIRRPDVDDTTFILSIRAWLVEALHEIRLFLAFCYEVVKARKDAEEIAGCFYGSVANQISASSQMMSVQRFYNELILRRREGSPKRLGDGLFVQEFHPVHLLLRRLHLATEPSNRRPGERLETARLAYAVFMGTFETVVSQIRASGDSGKSVFNLSFQAFETQIAGSLKSGPGVPK